MGGSREGFSLSFPPFPRRYRMRINPKAFAFRDAKSDHEWSETANSRHSVLEFHILKADIE